MPEGVQDDIEQILATIIRTSIDKEAAGALTDEQLEEKIAVSVQAFNGKTQTVAETTPTIPWWVYVIGGILVSRNYSSSYLHSSVIVEKQKIEEVIIMEEQLEDLMMDDINNEIETEGTLRRKQLEKMAKEKPEEFAKLLRTWIAEE